MLFRSEALAEELLARGFRLALITDKRGKDNYKGKLAEIDNFAVLSGGVVGKSVLFKVKSLAKVSFGILQSLYILLRYKPICVVGFGGYASFPASMAAILSGTNLVIHEQNSVMSRTNRFLSKYADLIAQSFKDVKFSPQGIKSVLVGMPIRKSISDVAKIEYPKIDDENKMQILILGGSKGAKIFSEIVPDSIKSLDQKIQKNIKQIQ